MSTTVCVVASVKKPKESMHEVAEQKLSWPNVPHLILDSVVKV